MILQEIHNHPLVEMFARKANHFVPRNWKVESSIMNWGFCEEFYVLVIPTS